jgi:hypothetical protein
MSANPIEIAVVFDDENLDVTIIDRKMESLLEDLRGIGIESGDRIFKSDLAEGEKGGFALDPTMVNTLLVAVLPVAIPKLLELLKSAIDEMGSSRKTTIKVKTKSGVEIEISANNSPEDLVKIAEQLAAIDNLPPTEKTDKK